MNLSAGEYEHAGVRNIWCIVRCLYARKSTWIIVLIKDIQIWENKYVNWTFFEGIHFNIWGHFILSFFAPVFYFKNILSRLALTLFLTGVRHLRSPFPIKTNPGIKTVNHTVYPTVCLSAIFESFIVFNLSEHILVYKHYSMLANVLLTLF